MNSLDEFAQAYSYFCEWLEAENPEKSPRDLLLLLLALMQKGMMLQPLHGKEKWKWSKIHQRRDRREEDDMVLSRRRSVHLYSCLPDLYFYEVFHPFYNKGINRSDKPVHFHFHFLLLDLYHSMLLGLCYYESGEHSVANQIWIHHIQSDAGCKLSTLIRSLFHYLEKEQPELLTLRKVHPCGIFPG